jgi:hypothetical protein
MFRESGPERNRRTRRTTMSYTSMKNARERKSLSLDALKKKMEKALKEAIKEMKSIPSNDFSMLDAFQGEVLFAIGQDLSEVLSRCPNDGVDRGWALKFKEELYVVGKPINDLRRHREDNPPHDYSGR